MRILYLIFIFILLVTPAYANVPISGLPPANTLTGAELSPLVQTSVTKKTTINAIADAVFTVRDSVCALGSMPAICDAFFGYASPRWYGGFCDSNFNANNNFHADDTGIQAALQSGYPVLIPSPGCKIATGVNMTASGQSIFSFPQPLPYSINRIWGTRIFVPGNLASGNTNNRCAIDTHGWDASMSYIIMQATGSIQSPNGGPTGICNSSGLPDGGYPAEFGRFDHIFVGGFGVGIGSRVDSRCNIDNTVVPGTGSPLGDKVWQSLWHDIQVSDFCYGMDANFSDAMMNTMHYTEGNGPCFASRPFGGPPVDMSSVRCEYSGFKGADLQEDGAGMVFRQPVQLVNYQSDSVYGPSLKFFANASGSTLDNLLVASSYNIYPATTGLPTDKCQIVFDTTDRIIANGVNTDRGSTTLQVPYSVCFDGVNTNLNFSTVNASDATDIGGNITSYFRPGDTMPINFHFVGIGKPTMLGNQPVIIGTTIATSGSTFDVSGVTDSMRFPTGTTPQRPNPPTAGQTRYNATTNALEAFINSIWNNLTGNTLTLFSQVATDVPLTLSGYGSTGLLTGNTAYYKFDDASGSTAVDSVAAANGTWGGTLGSQWGTGIINGDGVFNGTDNRVSTTYAGVTGTAARTISLWFKTTNSTPVGNNSPLIFYGTYPPVFGVNAITLATNDKYGTGTNFPGITLDMGTAAITYQASAIYDGNWHNLIFTMPAAATLSTMQVYIDGNVLGTVTHSSFPTTAINTGTVSTVQIGGSTTLASFFSGQIDEVGFWNRVLTASEIRLLYNYGHGYQYAYTGSQTSDLLDITNATGGVTSEFNGAGYLGIGTTNPLGPLGIVGLGTTAPIGTTTGAFSLCIDSNNTVYKKVTCP